MAGRRPLVEIGEPSTLPLRVYHLKRPHKKSRTGCTNCKLRKVKCDEARPICRACTLRNETCVYYHKPRRSADTASAAVTQPPPTSPVPLGEEATASSPLELVRPESYQVPPNIMTNPLFDTKSVDQHDMRLLWFYTASTCKSFNTEPAMQQDSESILRIDLLQHAFDKRFLLDTVLALSSLHTENLNMPVDRNVSLKYRVVAFHSYARAIEEADPSTFTALLANSLLMTALSSAEFRDPNSPDLHIISWMMVWRGIGLMIERLTLREFLRSNFCRLFYRPSIDLAEAINHVPQEAFRIVTDMTANDAESNDRDTYISTLRYLGSLYQHLKDGLDPIMKLRIITWFTFVPAQFTRLVQQKRPRALVIIAHYAAFLKLAQRVWWLVGVGDRTLVDIIRHLHSPWRQYMLKPIEVAGLHHVKSIGRVLTDNPAWEPVGDVPNMNPAASPALHYIDNVGNKVTLSGGTVVRGGPIGETVFNSQLYPPEHYHQQDN